MVSNPLSLVEFGLDSMDPENVLSGLADLLSTRAGASAAWAHFVAGGHCCHEVDLEEVPGYGCQWSRTLRIDILRCSC